MIFHNESSGWEIKEKIIPEDGMAGDFFGYSLAMNGRYLVVGAHNCDEFGLNSGAAYLFTRVGITWHQTEKFNPENPQEGTNFAESVDIDDSWISFGAPYCQTINGSTGAVFIIPAPVTTGIMDSNYEGIESYPNPVVDKLFILMPENVIRDIFIKVYDTQGRTIISSLNSTINLSKTGLDVSNLKSGIYLVNIETTNAVYSTEFIKL